MVIPHHTGSLPIHLKANHKANTIKANKLSIHQTLTIFNKGHILTHLTEGQTPVIEEISLTSIPTVDSPLLDHNNTQTRLHPSVLVHHTLRICNGQRLPAAAAGLQEARHRISNHFLT